MKKDFILLSDSEKFVIYVRRYFDSFLYEYGYSMCLKGCHIGEMIQYKSKNINQVITFSYDFLRSEKPYYQVYVEIEKKGKFRAKREIIEVINYFKNRKEPQTIEETLSLIKEFFSRCLIPVIRGEIWIDEIVKQNKK